MKKLIAACFARMWVLPFSASAATFEELMPKAQEGDAEAQYNLGLMYERGWGVAEDNAPSRRHSLSMRL